ncbi:MAG: MBOAT family protein [Lachnospiraceae bacterium]|nr:MBOAT family protein [Lachnospiraceae bacterium]
MSITSFAFLCCYAVLLLLYYVVPKKMQWGLLLIASIGYFLMAGELWLILYPIAAIIIIYCGALYIDRVKEQKKRKTALSLIVVFCLLVLAVLKYCNFGVYTYNALASKLHFTSNYLKEFSFLVPLGISFYTLALLGYVYDVYYEISKPQRNFLKFALFGLYFPVIISGPIVRYRDVENQLYEKHTFDYKQVTFGLQRILWGFFKKLVIAERMAVVVNTVYGDYAVYSGVYIVLATICFAFQLYADFSGGIDIVIGISETFGIKVTENFNTPFFSRSMQEFWRRWHITLGGWLKDYLFYPLLRTRMIAALQEMAKNKFGKKAGKRIATYTAMFVLWFAVGMWHGGSWKFIVGSGLLHWCYIVLGELLEPVWDKLRTSLKVKKENKLFCFFQQTRTFLLVCSGFLFFRSNSLTSACEMYKSVFTTWNPEVLWNGSVLALGLDAVELTIAIVSLLILLVVSVLQQKKSVRERLANKNIVVRWIALYALLFYVILFGYYGPGYSATEFIYQGF